MTPGSKINQQCNEQFHYTPLIVTLVKLKTFDEMVYFLNTVIQSLKPRF